ncbi:hypothetical protein N8D56_03355 [Devosia sp. A8/3-2]|nr:hypothetical protein N8D56_03355 [Devosia sp. A8/3-2]
MQIGPDQREPLPAGPALLSDEDTASRVTGPFRCRGGMDQRLTQPAPAPKRARNSSKTKADIPVAGRAEFAERGFEGARVDAIAERGRRQ